MLCVFNFISKVKRVGNNQKKKLSILQGWKRKYTLIFPSPVMHGWEDIMDSYTIAVSQENSKVTFFFLCKTYSWNNNVRQRMDNSIYFCASLFLSFKSNLKNIRIFPVKLKVPWNLYYFFVLQREQFPTL